tara:strand:- start:377 stop:745 length:369 start_codon:yes stop_codon:yes gene_type:complete
MGTTPKPDKKPKYNSSKPFEWIDSQWEKFMTEQKEHKAIIKQLRDDLVTCNQHFQKQRDDVLELTMKNAELRDRLIDSGDEDWLESHDRWMRLNTLTHTTPNNMELGKKVRTMVWKENDQDN